MEFEMSAIKKLVPRALKEPGTGDVFLDDLYTSGAKRIGVPPQPYYKMFYLIAKEFQPGVVVELGSWRGWAAAHFAVGNPAGHVATVDIHREDKNAQAEVRALQSRYPNLTYYNSWTWDPNTVEEISRFGKIDVLYMDAWHEYEYMMKDWEAYLPLLSDTALVIVDDVMDAPGATVDMVKFWDGLPAAKVRKYISKRVHGWIPMGFMKYERKRSREAASPGNTVRGSGGRVSRRTV
jgi:predicted O-methyltransferase YrrM